MVNYKCLIINGVWMCGLIKKFYRKVTQRLRGGRVSQRAPVALGIYTEIKGRFFTEIHRERRITRRFKEAEVHRGGIGVSFREGFYIEKFNSKIQCRDGLQTVRSIG
jgi:hypothetical protein